MKNVLIGLLLLFGVPAEARTFAHVESGQALDPQPNDVMGQYLARFVGIPTSNWVVVVVPDDTQQNATATPNGDGTYTIVNPVVSLPPTKAIAIGGKAFVLYCASAIASADKIDQNQALARFGQIVASMKGSNDPQTTLAFISFQSAMAPGGVFTVAEATTLLQALVSNGAANTVTSAEATAIIINWPKA